MLKVGILGLGTISSVHTDAYRKIDGEDKAVKLVACCDIREETHSKVEYFEGICKYTDIDEFLEKEQGQLDYVDICLPTYLHAEVSIKAMKMGYNVLCEKPMALNTEQAEAMAATSKETGKTLMIAHCMRFQSGLVKLKEILDSGILGKPYCAEFFRGGGSRAPMGYQNWFRDASLSGSSMLDYQIHDTDLINWMFGMPKALNAAGVSVIEGTGFDSSAVLFHYDGLFVTSKSEWCTVKDKYNTRGHRINCEKGYIFFDRTPARKVFMVVPTEGEPTEYIEDDLCTGGGAYYNEIRYYIDCLAKGKPVDVCPPEDSVNTIKMVMASIESAEKCGEKISIR